MGIQKGLLLTTHIWLHGCAKVEKEALPQIKQKKLVKQTNSDYIWTISLNILQCGSAYCSPPTPLFSNGNAKKPFCRRVVNHFMDVLKQKIIGLSCTDLVLVPILQGAIPYTYSKAEIQWLFASIKERVLIYAALFFTLPSNFFSYTYHFPTREKRGML